MISLEAIRGKPERLIIGVMSGTSADSVDAALCVVSGFSRNTHIRLIHFCSVEYPDPIHDLLIDRIGMLSVEEVTRLNFLIGKLFGKTALKCIEECGLKPQDIDLIASHGQTLMHLPDNGSPEIPSGGTLQVGDISVIAQTTGVLTVGNFRTADMAQGGQGSPLLAYADYILFRDESRGRIIQNLGGIANLTYIPPRANLCDLIAFDTGPGNMVIDAIVRLWTHGALSMDRNGVLASRGTPDEDLVQELLAHPYFSCPPPKSTGREIFGMQYARFILGRGLSLEDSVATAAELTVRSICRAYRNWVIPRGPVHDVILGGGGAKNPYIVKRLREEIKKLSKRTKVLRHEEFGVPGQAKECISLAILGNDLIGGYPQNVPSVTGARKSVILGQIALP